MLAGEETMLTRILAVVAVSCVAFSPMVRAEDPGTGGGGGGGRGNRGGGGGGGNNDPLSGARAAAEVIQNSERDKDKKVDKQKDAADKKAAFQDYKGRVQENVAYIKDLFQRAEAAWKAKSYLEAGTYYQNVATATAPGTEDMVQTSNERINVDMEKLARDHITASDDAGMQHDYAKQIDELGTVLKEFKITKAKDEAQRKMNALKSRPEVAGFIEYTAAEQLISDGKLTDGLAALNAILTNPRYDHTIPALRATRKIEELNRNEETRGKVKQEFTARADKEAPNMLRAAKNFNENNMPKAAREKLQLVMDKYPGTTYADEAKKMLESVAK